MKTLSFLPRGCDYRGSPHNGPFVPGRVEDVIHGDVSVVLDVLHLLPVSVGFLESFDDESSGRGTNSNLSLSVLHSQLYCDLQSFPIAGGLGDIFTNLLGRQTEGTDFRSQR